MKNDNHLINSDQMKEILAWGQTLERLQETILRMLSAEQDLNELFKDDDFWQLTSLLNLNQLRIPYEQIHWSTVVFLLVWHQQQKGEPTNLGWLYKKIDRGNSGIYLVNQAINHLQNMDLLFRDADSKKKSFENRKLSLCTGTINQIMEKSAVCRYNDQQIFALHVDNLSEIFHDNNHHPSYEAMIKKFSDLLEKFDDLPFVKKVKAQNELNETEKIILCMAISAYIKGNAQVTEIQVRCLMDIHAKDAFYDSIYNGTNQLISSNLLVMRELKPLRVPGLSLTENAQKRLGLSRGMEKIKMTGLKDIKSSDTDEENIRDNNFDLKKLEQGSPFFSLVKRKDIPKEQLFFNQEVDKHLALYQQMLSKNDSELKKKLTFSRKLQLMFTGTPGTGKSAAACQLARNCGRDIIHVNWQTFRSRWIGESEKNMRYILETVEKLSKQSKRVPVVVFNEAEAFFSRRVEAVQASDRMENNVVSLLLEWLEKKDPFAIIIFTSNHLELMDKAFERRIEAVHFHEPDFETRLSIWKAANQTHQLKLSEEQLLELSHIDISGAQIMNAIKKYQFHQIAYDQQEIDFGFLAEFCASQKWLENKTPVGFKF